MRHLDEGSLAEFLDEGARQERQAPERRQAVAQHLERCAECRARLEAARAEREQARGILAAASPDPAPAPAFEDIRARARGAGSRARGFPYRAVGLAAAVMLVAGVTWVVVSPGPPDATEQALAPPSAPAPTQPAGAAGAGDAAGAAEAPAETAPARDEARRAPPPAAPVPAPTRQLAEAARPALPGAGAASVPDTTVPAAAERAAFDVENRREALPSLAASAVTADRWRPVTRAEAERLLDGALATVPGLPILSHQVLQEVGPVTVRTVQALAGAVELELIQRRGELRPDTQTVVPNARIRALDAETASTLSVRFDGFVVTGRGRVPPDSLRALLDRLRG